ncbi:hypothetical protein R8510_05168 [Ralstonia chuxiongensis]|nr:hypothetical protein R8510_05168 [Ralstonia chuxiongensis]
MSLQDQDDFTTRYAALLEHYGLVGTRNNRGPGHENGSVESSHRYLKEAADQALMPRGHRDFDDRAAYDEFLREIVMRRNRRNAAAGPTTSLTLILQPQGRAISALRARVSRTVQTSGRDGTLT